MRITALILILVFAGSALFQVEVSRACSCAGRGWPTDVLEDASVVFAGIPLSKHYPLDDGERHSTADPVIYTFLVTHVWKGEETDTLVVRTARSTVSCGYKFEMGEHYLVHARGDSALWTGLCSYNSPIEHALWDRCWLPDPIYKTDNAEDLHLTTADLIDLLDDEELGCEVPRVLAHLPDQREMVLDIFLEIIGGSRPGCKTAVIGSLREMGPEAEAAFLDLRRGLNSPQLDVRWQCLRALNAILGPEEFSAFLEIVTVDQPPYIRRQACELLPRDLCSIPKAVARDYLDIACTLARDDDAKVRRAALPGFESMNVQCIEGGALRVVSLLRELATSDPDRLVRTQALSSFPQDVCALEKELELTILETLMDASHDSNPWVRGTAASQLARLELKTRGWKCLREEVSTIRDRLEELAGNDPDEQVRSRARVALQMLDHQDQQAD